MPSLIEVVKSHRNQRAWATGIKILQKTKNKTVGFNMETEASSSSTTKTAPTVELPENRFALELEFGKIVSCCFYRHGLAVSYMEIWPTLFAFHLVQSLASPAYLHYLATNTTSEGQSLLLCPRFKAFLRYLHSTWSQPEYSRFITYPHSLYFLELLIKNDAFCRELAQVSFRNFCHQQQYYAWQNRFATLFGTGERKETVAEGGGAGQVPEPASS